MAIIELESSGWSVAYTDGSTEQHPQVGWAAGYSCTLPGEWQDSGHLPIDSPQTNNTVELHAIIQVLAIMQGQDQLVAIAIDSQYAFDGGMGLA